MKLVWGAVDFKGSVVLVSMWCPKLKLCVIFAFLALFAVNCFIGFFPAKYAKSRKGAQRNPKLGHYPFLCGLLSQPPPGSNIYFMEIGGLATHHLSESGS
jgi:hypothetical protein